MCTQDNNLQFYSTHLLAMRVCQVENGTWDANAIKSLEAATSFELVPSELRSTKPEAANGGADFDKPNLGYTIGGDDGLGETALLASLPPPANQEPLPPQRKERAVVEKDDDDDPFDKPKKPVETPVKSQVILDLEDEWEEGDTPTVTTPTSSSASKKTPVSEAPGGDRLDDDDFELGG